MHWCLIVIDLSNGLDPFSPLGILFLAFGVVFSVSIPYFLIKSNEINPDKDTKTDRDKLQAEKIASLYPKKP
tara:strand:- start:111 stop:326 length:216 start_codon:yes stop_codon:yes gene_type:complete